MEATATAAATGVGEGEGEIAVELVEGRSALSLLRAHSPLRLLTPQNHGNATWIFTSTYGGGLVDGDVVRLRARVAAGAAALVGTQASTKVYRCADGSPGSAQHLAAQVDRDALLVWLPDPIVCFARARYTQRATIDLAAGASLIFVEGLTAGRSACGERWAFTRYDTRTSIHVGGKRVATEATLLDPAHGALGARMGRADAVATIFAFGPRVADVRRDLLACAPPLTRLADLHAAASPIGTDGVALRLAGASSEAVARAVREALRSLPAVLGDDPHARKW